MTQVDVTFVRATKVYWSLLWRIALFVAVPLGALGTVAFRAYSRGLLEPEGLFAGALTSEAILAASVVAGVALFVVMPVCIVRRVLRQAYADFRIVLEGPPRPLRIEPQLDPVADKRRRAERPAPKRIEPTFDVEPRRRAPHAVARV